MGQHAEAELVFLSQARRRIYAELQRCGALGAQDLATQLRLARSTVGRHLAKMEAADTVERREDGGGMRYVAKKARPSLALAHLLLQSLPARELVQCLVESPGQHLGQAAEALGAPRSRYWRVVDTLVAKDLLTVRKNVRQQLLYPTELAEAAIRSLPPHEIEDMIRAKSRRLVRTNSPPP